MPSFTVTSAGEKAHVDATGAGTAQYTVTNTSGDTLAGRLLVVPEEPANAGWFSVGGAAAREFTSGAAEQVVVQIAVPAGTAPGTYAFRLDAVSEANPDEDFTQGPTVSFDVSQPPPPVPWWKKNWWIFVVAGVVLLAIVGVVLWLLLRGNGGSSTTTTTTAATTTTGTTPVATATVPNVVGQSGLRAIAILQRLRFEARATTIFTAAPSEIGIVLKQRPTDGAVVPVGSAVLIGVGQNKLGAFKPATTTTGK